MSEPIIRTGDIPALSKAVTKTCEAVGEVARQNKILAEAVSILGERIVSLEHRRAGIGEDTTWDVREGK